MSQVDKFHFLLAAPPSLRPGHHFPGLPTCPLLEKGGSEVQIRQCVPSSQTSQYETLYHHPRPALPWTPISGALSQLTSIQGTPDSSVGKRIHLQCRRRWFNSWVGKVPCKRSRLPTPVLAQTVVCLQCRRPRFDPWVRKIPWRRKWQPTPVFLPGKSHGLRILVGYSLWSGTRLSDFTFTFTCTHSSILGLPLWLSW